MDIVTAILFGTILGMAVGCVLNALASRSHARSGDKEDVVFFDGKPYVIVRESRYNQLTQYRRP